MSNQPNQTTEDNSGVPIEIGVTKVDLHKVVRPISDVLEEIAPQGERRKAAEFVDQDVVIHSIRFFKGQFGTAAFVIMTDGNGELFNTILSQKIVLPKLAAVKDNLPVSCRLVYHKREGDPGYYDIE